MARAARRDPERRLPERKELRDAMDHVQELWRQLWSMSPEDPARADLIVELQAAQTRVLALRLKHKL